MGNNLSDRRRYTLFQKLGTVMVVVNGSISVSVDYLPNYPSRLKDIDCGVRT